MKRRESLLSQIMAEHVEMPGFPQLIVTRHFIYQWLKGLGWDESERGYSSLDYTTFGREAVSLPLTPDIERDHYLNQIIDAYKR